MIGTPGQRTQPGTVLKAVHATEHTRTGKLIPDVLVTGSGAKGRGRGTSLMRRSEVYGKG
jgi:hypothetical protein